MSRRMALARILFGLLLVGLMYAGPYAYGLATAGDKVPACMVGDSAPRDVVVQLSYTPGPTQIEDLQRYGRYGGSGGDLNNVVLLGVPAQNVTLLSRLYWVDRVEPVDPC